MPDSVTCLCQRKLDSVNPGVTMVAPYQQLEYNVHCQMTYAAVLSCVDVRFQDPWSVLYEEGLFHMMQFYSDGAMKAFWRDVLGGDWCLTQTKVFAMQHRRNCEKIDAMMQSR